MNIISIILTLFITIIPAKEFICDGAQLSTSLINNQNGDYEVIEDLEKLDKGAFVLINWKKERLMLPISFKANQINFTDKKWLWSYKSKGKDLDLESPRLAKTNLNGSIVDYKCNVLK